MNINSTYFNRTLQNNMEKLNSFTQKLSTGNRINKAADDSAGLNVSERLKAKINSYNKGTQNLLDAKSMIQTLDGVYGNITNMFQNMKELSIQFQNGTNSILDKKSIEEQIISLQQEVKKELENLTFNNKKIALDSVDGNLNLSQMGDIVKVANNSTTKLMSDSITMEATVKLDSYTDGTWTNDRSFVIGKTGNYYLTVNPTGKVAIYKAGATPSGYFNSTGTVPLGMETTISGVFTDTNAKIYINGTLDSSFSLTSGGYSDSGNELKIGSETPVRDRQVQGTIDNVRIYERALLDAEVSDNYNGNVSRDRLAGEWTFDNDHLGSAAIDSSGNTNDGMLFGNAKIEIDENTGLLFNTGVDGIENRLSVAFSELNLDKLGLGDLVQLPNDIINRVDRAINIISSERGYAGSLLNKIEFRIKNNEIASINHQESNKKIMEVDMSSASSELIKYEIKQNTTISILKTYNNYNQEKLRMLQD